jgi:hypothetical protein
MFHYTIGEIRKFAEANKTNQSVTEPRHSLTVQVGFEAVERVEDNLGDDQPGIFLVIGGNNIPRRMPCARRAEAFLISLPVILPEFALLDAGYRCRKNLTIRVPFSWRCRSRSTMELQR